MQEWTGEKSTATISKEFSALFTMSEPLSPMNWKSRAVACFLVKKLIGKTSVQMFKMFGVRAECKNI